MKERTEKKKLGMMLFVVILMVGSVFSVIFYGFASPVSKQKQNGYSFSNNGLGWVAKIDGKTAMFSFLPSEVSDLKIEGTIPSLSGRVEIDSTSNANDRLNQSIALANHQMGLTLFNYGIFLRNGFSSNNTYNFPIITCKDSTPAVPVIFFKFSNETKILVEENCIHAYASNDADVLKIKDRLVYSALGVING